MHDQKVLMDGHCVTALQGNLEVGDCYKQLEQRIKLRTIVLKGNRAHRPVLQL